METAHTASLSPALACPPPRTPALKTDAAPHNGMPQHVGKQPRQEPASEKPPGRGAGQQRKPLHRKEALFV